MDRGTGEGFGEAEPPGSDGGASRGVDGAGVLVVRAEQTAAVRTGQGPHVVGPRQVPEGSSRLEVQDPEARYGPPCARRHTQPDVAGLAGEDDPLAGLALVECPAEVVQVDDLQGHRVDVEQSVPGGEAPAPGLVAHVGVVGVPWQAEAQGPEAAPGGHLELPGEDPSALGPRQERPLARRVQERNAPLEVNAGDPPEIQVRPLAGLPGHRLPQLVQGLVPASGPALVQAGELLEPAPGRHGVPPSSGLLPPSREPSHLELPATAAREVAPPTREACFVGLPFEEVQGGLGSAASQEGLGPGEAVAVGSVGGLLQGLLGPTLEPPSRPQAVELAFV